MISTISTSHILLAFASWEDRFALGLQEDLKKFHCSQVVVFYFRDYASQTESARLSSRSLCLKRNVEYHEVELNPVLPGKNLERMKEAIETLDSDIPIVVDISTMPREVIWHIFWLCEDRSVPTNYRYHSPTSYSDDWVSRNPARPRLVHKLSGIALSGSKTALLLVVGYDIQRVWRLVRFFEPSRLMMGLQQGSRFAANEDFMMQYAKEFPVTEACSTFQLDAFAQDHGLSCIQTALQAVDEDYNVILGSLGPKLTAVSLYRIQRQSREMGLVYAPAHEFNPNYSQGIGSSYQGVLGD